MESLRATLLALLLCGITAHFSTGMIIYRDVITGDEMFSDFFKIRPRYDGILYEVEGESKNKEGMVALLNYREDGTTPYMLFFKDGLEEEEV
ncbi:TPT1 [Branchiostoma lanceolatum]|uniref:TPT1 protein n=1 Tax=Branchiostoma lanceolatum TaxID=7740 RepID=A0A8J9ZQV5_BRALA|nr:TPT1 [Branchiostoma lanceolatum]